MITKERTTITIDADIFREAKNKGLNISSICEEALKNIVLTFDQNIMPEHCTHRWTNPSCTPYGLVKECLRCHTVKKVAVEGTEMYDGSTSKKMDTIYEEIQKNR